MDPHSRAPKKNTSHGNEVRLQDTTHLIQRPCYQQGSSCQDPEGNWTTRRPPDDRKETQTAVVWPCFPFIRSGQNHLARHSEKEKTRQDGASGGKTTSGNGQAWSSASCRGQWRTGKNGGNGLQNHLCCPNDPRGYEIDDDDDDDDGLPLSGLLDSLDLLGVKYQVIPIHPHPPHPPPPLRSTHTFCTELCFALCG